MCACPHKPEEGLGAGAIGIMSCLTEVQGTKLSFLTAKPFSSPSIPPLLTYSLSVFSSAVLPCVTFCEPSRQVTEQFYPTRIPCVAFLYLQSLSVSQ